MGYIPAMIFNKPDFGGPLSVRVETLENNEQIYQVFEYLGQSTSGTITIPTEATIFDFYNDGILDAIMVEADANQNPTDRNATNSLGEIVQVTSLNNDGDYVLDSIPTVNSCIVYFIKIKAVYAQNVPLSSIVESGIPLIQTAYGVVTVAKSNADFKSVKDACDYVSGIATVLKPFVIKVVGAFSEVPFVIPSYTKVVVESGSVMATDPNNPLITMSGEFSEYRGGNIIGPSNSDAIKVTAGSTAVKDVVISSSGLCAISAVGIPFPGRLLVRNITVAGGNKGVCVDDSFVIITTSSVTSAVVIGCEYINNSIGIIDSFVVSLSGSDLYVDPTCSVTMNASQMDRTKVSGFKGNELLGSFNSTEAGDPASVNAQEVHVGVPEKGREFVAGEGDSYTRGMYVYTKDTLNTFVDVSVAAGSSSGSTVSFPGLAAGNAIYMASDLENANGDKLTFYGLKTSVATAATLGTGNFIIQYYNAINGWTDAAYMETQSDRRYYQYAKDVFRHAGSHHIRGPVQLQIEDDPNIVWDLSDPIASGTDRYWIRLLIDNDIDASPVFEQFKLHTNRFEVNTDGWIEYFGSARPKGRLSLSPGRELSGSMINKNIWIDNNLGAGLVNNQFSTTSQYNGALGPIPDDLDTSSVAKLTIYLRSDTAQSITLDCNYGSVTSGDIAYITNPALIPIDNRKSVVVSHTFAAPGEIGVLEFDLDFSDLRARKDPNDGIITPDLVALTVNTTVLPSNVQIISESVDYFKWSEGGHI